MRDEVHRLRADLQARQLAAAKLRRKHEALALKGRGQEGAAGERGSAPQWLPPRLHTCAPPGGQPTLPSPQRCLPVLCCLSAGEEAPGQAYYIIRAAQEKQELAEQVGGGGACGMLAGAHAASCQAWQQTFTSLLRPTPITAGTGAAGPDCAGRA
jgi:hypothetical protein